MATEPTPTDALLPCPFCGGEARHLPGKSGYWIERVICDACHFHLLETGSHTAVERWNRRAKPAPAAIQEQPAVAGQPFGYFHQLLDHEGKGNGVWLGTAQREVTERAHTPGETSEEIVTLYTTPQPTQAQAGAVPLTDEQIDEMHGEANRGYYIEREHYWKAVRDTEAAHGITKGA